MNKYFQVTNGQIFTAAILIGLISGAVSTINSQVMEHLQLPLVIMGADGKCAAVENFKNGDAYTCNDIGGVLRKYRTKK